jgi:hypothetical protein
VFNIESEDGRSRDQKIKRLGGSEDERSDDTEWRKAGGEKGKRWTVGWEERNEELREFCIVNIRIML